MPPHKRPYHDTKWGAVGPFWQAVVVTDVTTKLFRDYYARRRRHKTQYGEAPSNATLRKDAILLRLILTCSRLQPPLCRSTLIARPCVTADYLSSILEVTDGTTAQSSELRTRTAITVQQTIVDGCAAGGALVSPCRSGPVREARRRRRRSRPKHRLARSAYCASRIRSAAERRPRLRRGA